MNRRKKQIQALNKKVKMKKAIAEFKASFVELLFEIFGIQGVD